MAKSFPGKVKEAGFCCIYAFMKLYQSPQMRGVRKYGLTSTSLHWDVTKVTIQNWRKRFDRGECACEGQAKCMKKLFTSVDPKMEEIAHLAYKWPAAVQWHSEGYYVATFRDYPGARVEVKADAPLQECLTQALSDHIESCIKLLLDIPERSKAREGEFMVGVHPLLGPKLRDYLIAKAKMKKRLLPNQFS